MVNINIIIILYYINKIEVEYGGNIEEGVVGVSAKNPRNISGRVAEDGGYWLPPSYRFASASLSCRPIKFSV